MTKSYSVNTAKIVNIASSGSNSCGIAYLQEQANQKPEPEPKEVNPEWPAGKCLKMRCILEAIDYYIPDGAGGPLNEPPYHPFGFEIGYSVLKDGHKIISIFKHQFKRFYQTGISTEIVDAPEWWDRRNEAI